MRQIAILAALGAATLAAAACGSSSSSSSSSSSGAGTGGSSSTTSAGTTATPVATIAAEVPAAIKSKGTLVVAADATYAPDEFIDTDGKTVIGWDVDLIKAIAQVLGIQVDVQNQTFDSIIPGLASGKFDLGVSSFTDTKEREKTLDFVTYFSVETGFMVKGSGGAQINSLDDLCGHHVAVEKGTTQQDDATAQNKKCTDAGKPAVDVRVFTDQTTTNLDLQNGRSDVVMLDYPVAVYQVKTSNGQFALSGQPYGPFPYGIAIPKGNGMAKPVLDAVKELISDGVYIAILNKWGIQAGAITNPVINGAVN
jgi:polar amino acid transport system substrate-binding protein